MKKPSSVPRFLPDVLQAICELKEVGGSNTSKIVSYVKANGRSFGPHSTPRNLSTQVRRALNHATANGTIRQRAGKFRVNKDVFDPYRDCAACRRRKRQRKHHAGKGRRRRRRGRQHAISGHDSDSEELKLVSDSDNDLPVRELRRRRKRKGSRRRRRHGRRHAFQMPPKNVEHDGNNEEESEGKVYSDDHKDDGNMSDPMIQCDNPECLCNVKEEENEDMQNSDSHM